MPFTLALVGDLVPHDLATRVARHFDGLEVTPDRASQIALFVTSALELPHQGLVLTGDPASLRAVADLLGEEVKLEAVPHPRGPDSCWCIWCALPAGHEGNHSERRQGGERRAP